MEWEDRPWLASFGRRRGRKLPDFKQALVADLLPKISIDVQCVPHHPVMWLEIGFGGGEHLAAQAMHHLDVLLLGCEPYRNGVARLLPVIAEHRIDNIRILEDDARILLRALPDACLEKVFIFFPDPWSKARHKERRIVALPTLSMLARVMKPGAELQLATDHEDYAAWMLEHVLAHPDFEWSAHKQADWKTLPEGWVPTRYEVKTRAQGRVPVYYRCTRK